MKLRTFAALLLIAAAPSLAAPNPAPAPHSAEDFGMLPFAESPKLSPNGKLVAARVAADGKQYLAIVPTSHDKRPVFFANDKIDINWWRWVNDDWLVLGVGDVTGVEGEQWYITRTLAVSADGKTMRVLAKDAGAQNAGDVIWTSHDGGTHVLLAAQHSIYSDDAGFWPSVSDIDVATGRSRVLVQPHTGVMSWVADGQGVVRLGIGHDDTGRQTRILYRPDAKSNFREVMRANRGDDDPVVPSVFLPEPNKALAYADDDQGMGSIWEYDLDKLALGKKLYATPGFDIGGMTLNADRTGIAGFERDEDRSRIEWIDPDLQQLASEFAATVKGGHAELVSYSDDHSTGMFLVSGPDSPGAYFSYDRKAKAADLFSYRNDAIRMTRLNSVRTVRYKARDGLDIAAVLTLPRGATVANLPLIVMPHGGPFARDDESWDWWAQFLADRGYAVIQPNYRGSSGYGTPFARKGRGQWGLAMQDDLNDAVAYLARVGIADPRRVCMVGASYGGYAALRAAQRDGNLYRCAVSYAGVSDLNAMRRYDSQFLHGEASSDWLKAQAPDLGAVSPINHPEQFSIPLLVMHGRKDLVVPFAQSREMVEKLRKAGKPVTFIEQPLGDHHFTRQADRVQFLKELEAFLKANNPA